MSLGDFWTTALSATCNIDDSDEWGQWRQTVMSIRRSHFLSDPSAPRPMKKMAFTVTSSFSRRPIASAGGPLALLYLLRDGKICLEISTCRLAPFTRDSLCTCLQLEDREPYAGLGHADYAMAWDRSMPVCHCSVTNSNDTCAFDLPTYAVDPSRWGLPSLQSHSASPSYLTA